MKEALFYENEGDAVRCLLCPRRCKIGPGARGVCRGRRNVDGRLYVEIYGEYTSIALDPIEKKPLYHFYPGSWILSLGTRGCNLLCRFCQNWEISQGEARTEKIAPGELVDLALERKGDCIGIAYTYSEPLVWYEFVLDTAKLAHERGLANVIVTNGEINEEPLRKLLPYVDAMNIDVKAFREEFYRKVCGGELEPVKRTVTIAKAAGCHVELTNLIIPTLNDSPDEIKELVMWVASEVGIDTPLHFSRYFPRYKMTLPPTPVETLLMAREIAEKELRYVYIGNVPGDLGNDTFCHNCRAKVIERKGFDVRILGVKEGRCSNCGAELSIIL